MSNSTESVAADNVKYGERAIAEGELITFPNPRIGRRYQVDISLPEFTCKCPFSGYPDFATIKVTYFPDEKVVELKALKLYINSYRDRYISHDIIGDFSPRGNVHTVVEVNHVKGNN